MTHLDGLADASLHTSNAVLRGLNAQDWKRRTILVWAWADAPDEYRALSDHGGDEDWVGFVPEGMHPPLWMEGGAFGCCGVSWIKVANGTVCIGAHS